MAQIVNPHFRQPGGFQEFLEWVRTFRSSRGVPTVDVKIRFQGFPSQASAATARSAPVSRDAGPRRELRELQPDSTA